MLKNCVEIYREQTINFFKLINLFNYTMLIQEPNKRRSVTESTGYRFGNASSTLYHLYKLCVSYRLLYPSFHYSRKIGL